MNDEFDGDLRSALLAEAYRPKLLLDGDRLRSLLEADEQRRRERARWGAVSVAGLVFLLAVVLAAWPSFQTVPSAGQATSTPCPESRPTTHGTWWVEIGGPHAYFNVEPGTLYATDSPWLIITRFDPDAAQDRTVSMWAEPVPSGQRVVAAFNSRMDPVNIYRFSSPAPNLAGGWYLFQQRIPSAGCWRLAAAIDGQVVGSAVLDVRYNHASIAPTGSAAAPTPRLAPPSAWLPPWAGPATPMEVVTRSVLPFCGVEEGGPFGSIDAELRRCFVAALRDGTGAEFASIHSTTEGDPIATITRALPGGGLEVLVDSTQDAFGARVWSRTICRGFVQDQKVGFVRAGCDEGAVVR